MGIIYQKDRRSGITYAYESTSVWNKELKQSRAKRKLIGRVDPDTGEILIPGRSFRQMAAAKREALITKKNPKIRTDP